MNTVSFLINNERMDKMKNLKKSFKITFSVLLAAAVIIILFCLLFPTKNIASGVSVCGTNLGGMSEKEAVIALSETFVAGDDESFTLYTRGGESVSFSGSEISLIRDAEKTAHRAFLIGKSGNFIKDIATVASLHIKPCDFGYTCSFDENKLYEIIYNLGVRANGEQKKYDLEYDSEYVTVKKGGAGQSSDLTQALAEFSFAAGRKCTNIFVPLEKSAPKSADVKSLYDEIYITPVDASYRIISGSIEFLPETIGRQIDAIEAGTQIEKLQNGEPIRLKLVWLKPEVTLSELQNRLFNHKLSQYSTSYPASNKSRRTNVELAASKINGIILAPGESFSFNERVGARTKSAGYLEAPVFVNGESVQGTGGGVCQVSSTLYSAVLYADLKVIERHNHSISVTYVPKGQDATVSYGTLDFKFENNTEQPIKISASSGGGKLTISIYGTKPSVEKTVKITGDVTSTKEPTIEEIFDTTLATGTKKVLSAGKTGYTVETTRIVIENGKEVKREKMNRSTYKMVPTKVAVGTKIPAPLPTLAPTPQPNETSVPSEPPVFPSEETIETNY